MSVCHEPAGHTIFQQASPTFKKRFMYMSGIIDEDEFDRVPRIDHLGLAESFPHGQVSKPTSSAYQS
jgi:hypothetical protein